MGRNVKRGREKGGGEDKKSERELQSKRANQLNRERGTDTSVTAGEGRRYGGHCCPIRQQASQLSGRVLVVLPPRRSKSVSARRLVIRNKQISAFEK